jgi:hypothetical protein
VAPETAFQVNVALGPESTEPAAGEVRAAMVALDALTAVLGSDTRVNCGERFGFRMRDAVSRSSAVTFEMVRLLKTAEPDDTLTEVVPPSAETLSVMFMLPAFAAVKAEPLSVKLTTGAGLSGENPAVLAGGWVVKPMA